MHSMFIPQQLRSEFRQSERRSSEIDHLEPGIPADIEITRSVLQYVYSVEVCH